MRDFSLDFFSRNVELSNSEKLFINKYKNRPLKNRNYKYEALGLLTYLQMLLFSDSETGFYYDVSGNRFQLLAEELDLTNKELKQILDWAFEYSILDKVFYEKYQILTSYKMQEDYSKVLDRPEDRVRAQNINMDFVYQCPFTQKYENALQKYKNALQKKKSSQQKTGEETRQEDIKKDLEEKATPTAAAFSLEDFKNKYPNKKTNKELKLLPNINLELLSKKMDDQPWLLDKNNLDWAWCLKHYEDIINNKWAPGATSTKTKQTQNYSNREYSKEQLTELFDDLEKTEL